MSGDRYFRNPFPQFSEQASENIINIATLQLTPQSKSNIEKSYLELLKKLEHELAREPNWSDTSVYTGTSGFIYLYLHLSHTLKNETLIEKAAAIAESTLKRLRARRFSFLCGDAGPLALSAIVFHRLNDPDNVEFCLSKLKVLQKEVVNITSGIPDELLFGRVGYLYSLVLAQQNLGNEIIDDALIKSVIDVIFESGQALAKKEKLKVPLMYMWHDKHYVGAAHGILGIFFMLMQVQDRLSESQLSEVQAMVDYMCSLMMPSGNFPSSLGSTHDRLVHWCHGAPGAIFLFAKASQVFGKENYLECAKKSAEVVWHRGLLTKGYGLCHGAPGNGYALLYLFQVTNDPKYLYMAVQFGLWCTDYGKHGCRTPDRPFSLFEGLAGCIYYLSDLLDISQAKFPAFVL